MKALYDFALNRDLIFSKEAEISIGNGIIAEAILKELDPTDECQLKKANLDATVARVSEEIVRNGEDYRAAQEERRKAREEYRRERMVRKEREQSLLKEVKSL